MPRFLILLIYVLVSVWATSLEAGTPPQAGIQNITIPDDCSTIEEAYIKVADGGIITIKPGKYELSQTIMVNRNVTFRGSTGRAEDVIIDCPTSNAFQITSGSPSFQNLTIGSSGTKVCGGFFVAGGTPQLFHCIITSRNGYGMFFMGEGTNPRLEACVIKDCGHIGLFVSRLARGEFKDCEICGNADVGIAVKIFADPTFTRCKIHDGKDAGVSVYENGLGKFNECEIYRNKYSAIEVRTSGNPTFTGCKIHDGKGGGVCIYDKGMGTFNANKLMRNYTNGKLDLWDIQSDAGEVKGSGNTPEIPSNR